MWNLKFPIILKGTYQYQDSTRYYFLRLLKFLEKSEIFIFGFKAKF